ncbi:hypothetical protein RJ640_006358 [Escallonia rubra]|uniref:Uncharacterized protein n=1 Tax=Escallonia rubra TaxID=112253 RepID=A0AA88RCX9_9ASTE|nr:hypothetical protein RJ640_006358 [Escallonia rubra]
MGIPSNMRDAWENQRRKSLLIASPAEDQRILESRRCTQEGVRAGVKAASITCVATAVPTLIAVRVIPWAKANLNYTAQALIISAGTVSIIILFNSHQLLICSIAAYFITADKTILECARKNAQYRKSA